MRWLEMFITDHIKYPNDAIAASIQYFFNRNFEIKEFKDGFRGEKFGTFNHVTELIFNFALTNIDLGGILYPSNFFQNSLFYDHELFLKSTNNSEDFWQSAFIIIEDKILRQSSIIFDYTRYLIDNFNYEEYYINRKLLFEKSKILFLKQFPNFNELIFKRQKKIASYPERFSYLPDLISFIKNQSFPINKIYFFFYNGHKRYFNLLLRGVEIHFGEKNLRSHLKYFYVMKLYKDHAIITLDDDIGYANDTFESLFNAYVENPNIICGRRAHLMTYKNSGELNSYLRWIWEEKTINESAFNLTLTNGAGSIFPPDILNINNNLLAIINETITCDDLTLKYLSIIKGIPNKWIINNHIMGLPRILPNTNSTSLYNINKLNIIINQTELNNLCVPYRNIQTGTSVYIFDIMNQCTINKTLFFDVIVFSKCPIDYKLDFNITFANFSAQCFLNNTKEHYLIHNFKGKNIKISSCYMKAINQDLNDFYFPKAHSNKNLFIKIFNYRTYITAIFKDFSCNENNICILKAILYEQIYIDKFPININRNQYFCYIKKRNDFSKLVYPVIEEFNCILKEMIYNSSRIFISGLPLNINIADKISEKDIIPNQFIISKIVVENEDIHRNIIIIGNLANDLENDLYNFTIKFIYPNIILKCSLRPYSKQVQSKIYCNNHKEITNTEILIENQVVQTQAKKIELLLINKETFIKILINKNIRHNFIQKYDYSESMNILKNYSFSISAHLILYIIIIILIIIIKNIYKRKMTKNFWWKRILIE